MTNYAKTLTRDYLEYLGITFVSEDGTKIMKGDTEITQHQLNSTYRTIILYDPAVRKAIPLDQRNSGSGQIIFGVHRIVYTWYHRIIPQGFVIDHINNNKLDNRLENLQLLTPQDNINKTRVSSIKEIRCQMTKPREFYENKLNKYSELYEKAKENRDAEAAHKFRCNIAQCKARLRYWDSHKEEYDKYLKTKEKNNKDKADWRNDVRDIKMLKELAKQAKNESDLHRWHQLNEIIKNWKSYDSDLKEQLIQVILKGHNFKD